MIIPLKELKDNIARQNGHANWDLAKDRLSESEIEKLYEIVILKSTERGFAKGWKERGSRVSYPKTKLDEFRAKEVGYIKQTLLPND